MIKKIQKYLVVPVLALLGVAVYFLFLNLTPFDRQRPAVGESAPEIALADHGGSMVRLSDLRGKVVLVNFWASWCPPCKEEIPGFQKILLAYHNKGFAIISVSVEDIAAPVVKELDLLYPVVVASRQVSRDYGNIAHIPVSFLIGKDGKIIKKVKGVYSEGDLRSHVEQALKGQGG